MLAGIIVGPTFFDAKRQLQKAALADLLEFRIDLFQFKDLEKIFALKKLCKKPVILTYRKKNAQKFLEQLAFLHPDFLDIDLDIPLSFSQKMKEKHPHIKLIRSYHNFFKTENFETIFQKLFHPLFDQFKIAVLSKTSSDVLRALHFLKKATVAISVITMGPLGLPGRVLSPIFGSKISYALIEKKKNSSYIPTLEELCRVYRFKQLDADTKIFALVGNPISHSIGHLFHNWIFERLNKNAVYVKFNVAEKEFSSFFSFLKNLAFYGLSITTPFKKAAISFCSNEIDTFSINTLIKKKGKWLGKNTDAKACLKFFEQANPATVFILGAGSVAQAIAHVFSKYNCRVILFNRDMKKAKNFAEKIHASAKPLKDFFSGAVKICDFLVQATTVPNLFCWKKAKVQPKVALELVYDKKPTHFETFFVEQKTKVVSGRDFFFEQALLQQELWGETTSFIKKCKEDLYLQIYE